MIVKGSELLEVSKKICYLYRELVGSTLGPKGKHLIIGEDNPYITKDGITVAKYIIDSLSSPTEKTIAKLITQASQKTMDEAGDGTTSTVIFLTEILEELLRFNVSGKEKLSATQLKNGMDKAIDDVVEFFDKNTKCNIESEEDLKNIALISTNGDETIASLVTEAFTAVGKDGSVVLEETKGNITTLEIAEGYNLDSGYVAQGFCNVEGKALVYHKDALILVTDKVITEIKDLVHILAPIVKINKPLVIIADDITGEALSALLLTNEKAKKGISENLRVVAVKAPSFGVERYDYLQDIAIATGATYFSSIKGNDLAKAKFSDLGSVSVIECGKYFTTLIGGNAKQELIKERIEEIQSMIEQEPSEGACKLLSKRLNKLNSAVAVIKIGANTYSEMVEKKHRIEDALCAIRTSIRNGYHSGGGMPGLFAKLHLSGNFLQDDNSASYSLGYKSVLWSLDKQHQALLDNSGCSLDVLTSEKTTASLKQGINFATEQFEQDMIKAGIIEPLQVTVSAIKNAASSAFSLFYSSGLLIKE